jgi:hypothetical protein
MLLSFSVLSKDKKKDKKPDELQNQVFKTTVVVNVNFLEQKKTIHKIIFLENEEFVYEKYEGSISDCSYKVPGRYQILKNQLVLNFADNETWIGEYDKKDPNKMFIKDKKMYLYKENPTYKTRASKKQRNKELQKQETPCYTF